MRWLEFVVILILLLRVIETGKLSILRYVTQIVTRISRNRTANRSTIKDRKEELFDIDMIYGTAYNDWMSQVERTKTSINN